MNLDFVCFFCRCVISQDEPIEYFVKIINSLLLTFCFSTIQNSLVALSLCTINLKMYRDLLKGLETAV